ncbi:MAG: hypothetical protein ACTSRX_11170 [Promethearchaeota archaeon]
MQGVKSTSGKLVTLMGATNLPWDIDSAVLRRFEKKIYCGLPTVEGRTKIFELCTKEVEMDDTVDFKELGAISEGYSGSDIATVCREVVMLPVRELDVSGQLTSSNNDFTLRKITREDFINVLENIKPVVSDSEIEKFRKWREEFGG